MEEISKTSTIQLIKNMTLLDQEIDLMLLKYEKIRLELIKRYPNLKNSNEFQPKIRKKVL